MAISNSKSLKPNVIHVRIEDDLLLWIERNAGKRGTSEFIRDLLRSVKTGKGVPSLGIPREQAQKKRSNSQEMHLHIDHPVLKVDTTSVLVEIANRIEDHLTTLKATTSDPMQPFTINALAELVSILKTSEPTSRD